MNLSPEAESALAAIWKRVSAEHDAREADDAAKRQAETDKYLAYLETRAPYVELYHEVEYRHGFYEGENDVVRVERLDNEVLVTLDNTNVVHVEWDNVREHNLD